MLGVPNFGDVASNAPFALAGVLGLLALRRHTNGALLYGTGVPPVETGETPVPQVPVSGNPNNPVTAADCLAPNDRLCLGTMFVGLILTAFASGYYHWNPNNYTLVCDRIGLTIAFMGFMAALLGERLGPRVGVVALGPLVIAGAASVLYWAWTESRGVGDLRPYAFVQFFPLLALPYLALAFPPRYMPARDLFIMLGWYAAAKLLEVFDRAIYTLDAGLVSGHTLKHLAAAMGAWWIVRVIKQVRCGPSVAETEYRLARR